MPKFKTGDWIEIKDSNRFITEEDLNGWSYGNTPVVITAAITLDPDLHANRPLIIRNAAAFAITLPAATATGHIYDLFYDTTVTSVDSTVSAAGSDTMVGQIFSSADTAKLSLIRVAICSQQESLG